MGFQVAGGTVFPILGNKGRGMGRTGGGVGRKNGFFPVRGKQLEREKGSRRLGGKGPNSIAG